MCGETVAFRDSQNADGASHDCICLLMIDHWPFRHPKPSPEQEQQNLRGLWETVDLLQERGLRVIESIGLFL
jgi:hypothetical protein